MLATSCAHAATAGATFPVSITVVSVCSVVATGMTFPGITTGAVLGGIDATSTLTVNCTSGTPYSITLDGGQHSAGAQRRAKLVSGTQTVAYELYSDNARSATWTTLTGQTGDGTDQTLTVYGRLSPAQAIAATGAYTDVVTVSVTY